MPGKEEEVVDAAGGAKGSLRFPTQDLISGNKCGEDTGEERTWVHVWERQFLWHLQEGLPSTEPGIALPEHHLVYVAQRPFPGDSQLP